MNFDLESIEIYHKIEVVIMLAFSLLNGRCIFIVKMMFVDQGDNLTGRISKGRVGVMFYDLFGCKNGLQVLFVDNLHAHFLQDGHGLMRTGSGNESG